MFETLKHPAYTGENRCVPCTVVNSVLAVVFATAAWAIWSVPVAAGLLVVASAAIYFRGYLVPGTPTLTKRYFPDRVLRWFEKEPPGTAPDSGSDAAASRGDPETVLREAGVIVPCEQVDDLCLADDFSEAWYDRMDAVTADDRQRVVADLLDRDPESLSFQSHRGDAFAVHVDGMQAGQWESEAAFHADVAAANLFADRIPDWSEMSTPERSELLGSLRLFLERCPDCGGAVTLGQETVSSCCREQQVAAVTCEECEARLFEAPAS